MMTIRCAWHQPEPIVIGTKEGPDGVTDSICEACSQREFGGQAINRCHRKGPPPVIVRMDINAIDQAIKKGKG